MAEALISDVKSEREGGRVANARETGRRSRYSTAPRCRSASICSLVPPPKRAR